jgi:hypothetical protein
MEMNLYQFVLEIQEGVSSYEHKEFVLAPDDAIASRFAREFARHWRPGAMYDAELDVYSAPEGWPQWTLARCAPITHLTVPVAGKWSSVSVTLVPEIEVKK